MMQIVQELCKRPGLNRTGFDMPTIYVPSMNQKVPHTSHVVVPRSLILFMEVFVLIYFDNINYHSHSYLWWSSGHEIV